MAVIVVALVINWRVEPPSGEPTPPQGSSTPTPTPTPLEMPESVAAFGDLVGWSQAPTTSVARVLPQIGDAATGSVAAYIDAPVVDDEVVALEIDVEVAAGEAYALSAELRTLASVKTAVSAAITVGDFRVALPDLDAAWSTVTARYTAPDGTDSLPVRVVLSGPVSGLGIDDVALVPIAGGKNVVPNASFENVSDDDVILNRSLILPESGPLLALRVPEGTTTWQAKDAGGGVVAAGFSETTGGLTALPLEGLEQGYYVVSVKDAEGRTVSANLGVVDFEGASISADPRFGVGLHVENGLYDGSADLMSALGLRLARNDILWKHNEKTRGEIRFDDRYVDAFARLHAHGIHLLGIVNYGNWLYGSELTPETPEALAAYGRYASAIAQRFDLVGLEVFNEFNQERFNRTACGTDPSCYVPLLRVVEQEVRKVDPDLPLIAGSTARYDAEWFDGLWKDGGLQYADAISFHPYEVSANPESLAGIIAQARASMQDNASDTRPIWITELGTSSKTGGRPVDGQADYLVRTSITALANGVEKYFWYDLINDSPDPAAHEGNFGMFSQKKEGVAALQPKPVGYAQALMISQLGGRDFAGKESLAAGVVSYRFGKDDGVRVAWAPSGDTAVAIATDVPLRVVSMAGVVQIAVPIDGAVSVTLGKRPTFISSVREAGVATPSSPAVSQTPAP